MANDQYITAAEKAYSIIRENILDGKLLAGTRLSQRKMAGLCGVSIIPVIEALVRLENDGLVEYKPQWGARVTSLTREKVLDNFEMREAVECQVARILSCKELAGDQSAKLHELASDLDRMSESGHYSPDFWEKDYSLHLYMAQLCGYSSFETTLRRVNLFNLLKRASSEADSGHIKVPGDWHSRVVEAILSGDADHAEKQMRTHIREGIRHDNFFAE